MRFILDFLFPEKDFDFTKFPPSSVNSSALFDYGSKYVKEAIWQFKYKGNRKLAGQFGTLLGDNISALLDEEGIFGEVLLIPVPVSDKRRLERGFNQCELLCEVIKKSGPRFMYLPNTLRKIRHTESQTKTSSRRERLENLRGSMEVVDVRGIRGHSAVVVDDVMTTGATFAEAKRVLRNAGAKKVFCFALSH